MSYADSPVPKQKNFDLVRLAAAGQVMVYHGIQHLSVPLPAVLTNLIARFPGVPIFFVISGFLISASFARNPDIRQYMVRAGAFTAGPGISEGIGTPAEIATWYETTYAEAFEALAKATPDQLLKVVDFRGLFQRPAVMFLVSGLSHTIHHRGQLSSYLRSMGAKVPAIYGESYDSAAAKSASPA